MKFLSSFFKHGSSNDGSSLEPVRENYALIVLTWLTVIGIFALALFSIDYNNGNLSLELLRPFSIGLLIAGTSYAIGILMGFLFGIPKLITQQGGSISTTGSYYSDNDNLVQISDWLTKIIVGVGLTQLIKIPGYLQSLGGYLQICFAKDYVGGIVSVSTVIYFLIFGFLMSYLWTRLYFRKMLSLTEDDINKVKQQKENASNALIDEYTGSINSKDPDALKAIITKQTTIIAEKAGKTKSIISNTLTSNELTAIIDKAKEKMQYGLMAQSSLPESQKDPNKNQWGGKSQNNERKISAVIKFIDTSSHLYKVNITVESTNPQNPILEGDIVLFSLHNSWDNPYKIVVVKDSKAKLEIISYGSITVGAYINNDKTELELDLSKNPDAPKEFKEN
jgi:hypothetical protein